MAAGEPTGNDLCSGTYNGNTLPEYPTPHQNVKITFGAGAALTSGVQYAIVVRASGSGFANYAYWDVDAGASDDYAGGKGYTSNGSGSSWSNLGNQDFYFKTYTGAGFNVLRDNHTFADTGTPGGEFTDTIWKAQTFTATSSYTITAVNLELSRKAGAAPGTITVSIRATETGLPSKATTPAPTDAASNILLGLGVMTWADGGDTDTFDVWFGPSGNMAKVSSAQAGLSYSIGYSLNYNTTYQWRIDSTNENGTTTGDVWSYSCIAFAPPLPSGMSMSGNSGPNGEGTPTGTPTGINNMITIKKLVAVAENRFWYEDI
jgi:hypothetical protein